MDKNTIKNDTDSIKLKFQLFQKVKINILENIKGRVVSVWITKSGIKYQVRYFWNCEEKEVYFFEDELEASNG